MTTSRVPLWIARGRTAASTSSMLRAAADSIGSELAERLQELELALVDFGGELALLRPLLPHFASNLAEVALFFLTPRHQGLRIALGNRQAIFQLLVHPGTQTPFVDRCRHDRLLLGCQRIPFLLIEDEVHRVHRVDAGINRVG